MFVRFRNSLIADHLYGTGRIAQPGVSGAQYFLGDALGSVRQLVDVNGEVYERALLAEMRRTVHDWNIRTPGYITTHSCIRDPIRGRYAMSNILLIGTKSIKFCINFSKSLDFKPPNPIMVVGTRQLYRRALPPACPFQARTLTI